MSNDPFAPPAPQGDPWAEEPQAPQNNAQPPAQRQPEPTVVGSGGKLVATLKGLGGPAAPWIVVHAEDTRDLLRIYTDPDFKKVMEYTASAGKAFHRLTDAPAQGGQSNNGGGGYQNQQQSGGQPGRPANANQAPNGQAKYCQHGEMVFRSGVNQQSGKAWQGHFCPQPKGSPDQCKPEFGR